MGTADDLGTKLSAAAPAITVTAPESKVTTKIADDVVKKITGEMDYKVAEDAQCVKIQGSQLFHETLCKEAVKAAKLADSYAKNCYATTTCKAKDAKTSYVIKGLTASLSTKTETNLKAMSAENLKTMLEAAQAGDTALKTVVVTPPTTQSIAASDDAIRLSKSIAGKIDFAMKDEAECKAVKASKKFGEKLCAELKTLAKLPTDYKADKKCTVSTTCATAKTSSSFTMLGLTDAQATVAKMSIQGTSVTALGTALKAALDSDDTTKGGTKTDPTETVAPVTIADDTEAKSDMETHIVYSLKEAAECEKVKNQQKPLNLLRNSVHQSKLSAVWMTLLQRPARCQRLATQRLQRQLSNTLA